MSRDVFVVYTFNDGEEKVPWIDVRRQELLQKARMANSDDPALIMSGREALANVAQELYDLKMELFIERLKKDDVSRKRSDAGKTGAESRWGGSKDVQKIIASLAMSSDVLGDPLPPSALWPEFFSRLDNLGVSPAESDSRITWDDNTKGMTFKTFSNKISTARGSVKINT